MQVRSAVTESTSELHVFPDGPHGMGFAKKAPHVGQWAGLMKNWLGYLGWL